jgi:ABC-type multidrug transport system fused ATPase/permease subunit
VLRKGVAMVQQDPVVLADTFYANVTLGRDYHEEQVWEVLETVQLAELARGFSEGSIRSWASRGTISPSGKSSCWRWRGC